MATAKEASTPQITIALGPRRSSLYSSVAERQSCKLKVLGSIPSGGFWRRPRARDSRMDTSRADPGAAPLHPCARGREPAPANHLVEAPASAPAHFLRFLVLLRMAFAPFFKHLRLRRFFCMGPPQPRKLRSDPHLDRRCLGARSPCLRGIPTLLLSQAAPPGHRAHVWQASPLVRVRRHADLRNDSPFARTPDPR